MSDDHLDHLTARIREFARERDWEQFHTPKNLAMALSGEVGELLEIFQWLTPEQSEAVMAGARAGDVEDELADVLIYLLRLADVLGVDLKAATEAKLSRNEQRFPPDRVRGGAGNEGVQAPARAQVNRDEDPVQDFFAWVDAIPQELYPDQLVPVAGRHVTGVAGFPAGRGLYAPCDWDHTIPPPFPFGGLMLVGNHLDAEDVYVERLAKGEANGDPCPGARRMRFWSMLYALLDQAVIPRSDIFVTNVHPALVKGSVATGVVRGSEEWLATCADLLRRQVDVMRPRAIAALGESAQRFVGEHFGVSWSRVPEAVSLEQPWGPTGIVAVRHPSASQSHAARREAAEVLREALGLLK